MILGLVPFRNPSCIEKMKCVKFSFKKKDVGTNLLHVGKLTNPSQSWSMIHQYG